MRVCLCTLSTATKTAKNFIMSIRACGRVVAGSACVCSCIIHFAFKWWVWPRTRIHSTASSCTLTHTYTPHVNQPHIEPLKKYLISSFFSFQHSHSYPMSLSVSLSLSLLSVCSHIMHKVFKFNRQQQIIHMCVDVCIESCACCVKSRYALSFA